MAKAVTIKVKLVSSADTGFYYVAKKNSPFLTDKLVKKSTTRSRASTSNSRNPRSSNRRPVADGFERGRCGPCFDLWGPLLKPCPPRCRSVHR